MWPGHNVVLRILSRKVETVTRFEQPESYVIKNAEFYIRLQAGFPLANFFARECSVSCGFVIVSALVSVVNLVLIISFRQFGF